MNDEIIAGDYVIYNGYIPDYIDTFDKCYIKRSLKVGNKYRIIKVGVLGTKSWCEIENDPFPTAFPINNVFAPIICFDKIYNIKEKYGLK